MGRLWFEDGQDAPLYHSELQQAALSMLTARRALQGALPPNLTHDVALGIMLTLYLAEPSGATIKSLADEATLPASSVARWLSSLVSEKLITIGDDAARLTAFGNERMDDLLTRVVRSQRTLMGWDQH